MVKGPNCSLPRFLCRRSELSTWYPGHVTDPRKGGLGLGPSEPQAYPERWTSPGLHGLFCQVAHRGSSLNYVFRAIWALTYPQHLTGELSIVSETSLMLPAMKHMLPTGRGALGEPPSPGRQLYHPKSQVDEPGEPGGGAALSLAPVTTLVPAHGEKGPWWPISCRCLALPTPAT